MTAVAFRLLWGEMASVLEDGGRASDCGQIEVAEEAYTALPGDKRPSTNLSRIKIRPQRLPAPEAADPRGCDPRGCTTSEAGLGKE